MSGRDTLNLPTEELSLSSTPTDIANFARHLSLAQFRKAVEFYEDPLMDSDQSIKLSVVILLNRAATMKND